MPTSRIPSPARSQGAAATPRRFKPRGPRSVGSPARSDVSGRLTSVINMKNSSFALSPMPSRRSVLPDTTDIEEPKRKSWWRELGETSRDVNEVIESNKVSTETENIVEDLMEMDVLSQEKKSYNLDLPESSDNESIHSIIMPQRKLFKRKENKQQIKFGQLIENRETLPKLHKTNAGHDKSVNIGPRELFNTNKQRSKAAFPAALLDITLNRTAMDKSKEKIEELPKSEVRNIFGNRSTKKRKNMFSECVVSESQDEIPEIQPNVLGSKKSDQKSRVSTTSEKKREPSPSSSVTTDVEEPKGKSCRRQLGENSRDVNEVIESKKANTKANDIVEDMMEMDVLSQERKSFDLDLPESSDNESIHSIIMPQRKLFKQKENKPQNKFGQLVANRETLSKLHKSNAGHNKSVNIGPRELFNADKQKNKNIFPANLLDTSLNKTDAEKSKEKIMEPPRNYVRNIFSNRPRNEFFVSESEDEIPEVQPNAYGFSKKSDQKSRTSTISRGRREPSPASSFTTDIELDDWRMLPSSTMVADQLEEAASATPVKRARLSKLSEAKESDAGTNSNATVDKTKQSNKSVTSKNKSKNVSSAKDKSLDTNRSMTTRNASKAMLENLQNNTSKDKDLNISSNKSKNNISKNKRNSQKNKSLRNNNDKNDTLEKSTQNISKSKTFNIEKHAQKAQDNNIDNLNEPNNDKDGEVDDNLDNKENNFTLEYEIDDQKVVTVQNDNKSLKNKTVTLKRDSNLPQNRGNATEEQDTSLQKLHVSSKKHVDETEESQTLKENELVSTDQQSNQTKIHSQDISKPGGPDKEINNVGQTDVYDHEFEEHGVKINKKAVNDQNQLKQQKLVKEQMEVDEIDEASGKVIPKQITFFNEDDNSMDIDEQNKEDGYEEGKQALELTNIDAGTEECIDKSEQNSQINRLHDKNNQSKIKNQENGGVDEIQMQTVKLTENVEQNDLDLKETSKQLQNEFHNTDVEQAGEVIDDDNLENENNVSHQKVQNTNNEQALHEIEEVEENDSDDEGNENDEERNESAIEQDHSIAEELNGSEEIEHNESEAEEENVIEAEEQNESEVDEQNESEVEEQNESEVEEQNESEDEDQNESEDEEQNETEVEKQNESKEIQNESQEEEDEDQLEQDENREEQNETEEEQNESQDAIQNESQESDVNEIEDQNESEEIQNESDIGEQNESQEEMNQTEVNEHNASETDEQNESEIEDQNESLFKEDNNSKEPSGDVIEETDTPNSSGIKSPEEILHDKTNQAISFTAQGRNTSIRKTKSMIRLLNIRPSKAPPRESTGLSDGARDSSAEGSGWDSHRTTRKTLRQTFGKDFTPRKSLRALVMEKSAKRQTYMDARSDITTLPQANSTEYPEMSNRDYDDDDSMVPSDHELSRRTRQANLEMWFSEIRKKNMERRQKTEMEVRNLFKPSAKENNPFKVPARPMFSSRRVTKPVQKKSKPKQINALISLDDLPQEILDDLKYKPPKRFQPASWATKRLYKFLETKLEPKYDYKARIRAEKLVESIYHFSKELRRHDVAPIDAVDVLKHEMARLEIVKTHFEFYEFFNDYMPREIRVKVVPDIVNKISMPKHGIFSEIQL